MKAIDSRNQSDNQRAELVNQQLKRVNADIQKAIKKGLYEVMVYENLYDEVHDQLQANGYQTFRRGGRMGDRNTLIKWNAAK